MLPIDAIKKLSDQYFNFTPTGQKNTISNANQNANTAIRPKSTLSRPVITINKKEGEGVKDFNAAIGNKNDDNGSKSEE